MSKYISQAGDELGKFFRIGDEAQPSFLGPPGAVGNMQVGFTRPQFVYDNIKTIANTIRADITSQVTFNHQLKAGFQLKLHDLSRVERNSTLGADAADLRSRLFVEKWQFYPSELGVYASDRMEFGGLVLNLGAPPRSVRCQRHGHRELLQSTSERIPSTLTARLFV